MRKFECRGWRTTRLTPPFISTLSRKTELAYLLALDRKPKARVEAKREDWASVHLLLMTGYQSTLAETVTGGQFGPVAPKIIDNRGNELLVKSLERVR